MEETWTLRYEAATERLFLRVDGWATEAKARPAVAEFRRLLGSNTVDFVADLEKLTGYATGARRVWQDGLFPVRRQLRRICVIGANLPPMIRMAATVVAAVIGVPISFHKTIDELK